MLSYDYMEIGTWDPKVNTRPRKVSTIAFYPALKPAFDAFMQLDKRQFNEPLSILQQLPQIINTVCIMDDKAHIVMLSRYIEHNALSDLKDGVYIELNSKHFSKAEFERETGYTLGTRADVVKSAQLDYYLLPNTTIGNMIRLNGQQRKLLVQMRRGPRIRRTDDNNGMKM